MSRINHSRANTHEKHPIFGILGAELGHDSIGSGFSDSVRSTHVELVVSDQFNVCHSSGDGDNLLLLALEDEWKEQVEEMNSPNNVRFATCHEFFF